jgi:hypothetical protein
VCAIPLTTMSATNDHPATEVSSLLIRSESCPTADTSSRRYPPPPRLLCAPNRKFWLVVPSVPMAAILLYLGIKSSSSWWSWTSLPSQIPSNSSVITTTTTTTHPHELNIDATTTTAVDAAVDMTTVATSAPFPPDFVWGVATSSYQIEGATQQDGRGVTIWDTFVRIPGHILDGSTGDTADDHYHWYVQDVALMSSWNVTAYRFSIAWSRILPTGRGPINEAGIRFYDGLIDELLRHNIEPWITLFHWDLPQALQTDYEGWLDKRTVDCYCYYARIVFQHFAHKVKRFITLNEPWT